MIVAGERALVPMPHQVADDGDFDKFPQIPRGFPEYLSALVGAQDPLAKHYLPLLLSGSPCTQRIHSRGRHTNERDLNYGHARIPALYRYLEVEVVIWKSIWRSDALRSTLF